MSASPETADRDRPIEIVGGFISAAAIVAGAFAVVEHPVRIGVFAVVAALVAAGIGGRHARLAAFAVTFATVGWVVGMIVAVMTGHALW